MLHRKWQLVKVFILFSVYCFGINIDAIPNGYTPCPSDVYGNCPGDTYFGDIQIDMHYYSVGNNEIGFRVRKCNQTNFSQGGTLYLKFGDEVCSPVIAQTSFSSGVSEIGISMPLNYWVAGTVDITATITSNSTEKFWTGVIHIVKECEDYHVTDVSIGSTTIYQGQQNVALGATVENLGNETGNDELHWVRSNDIFYDPGVDVIIGNADIDISPGSTQTVSDNFDVPIAWTPGNYKLLGIADEDDSEEECSENNNRFVIDFTVNGAPNLKFSNIQLVDVYACANGTAEIRYRLQNTGSVTITQNFWMEFFLSSNTSLNSSDIMIGRILEVVNINAGATTSYINRTFNIPAGESGLNYIIGDIDPDKLVDEHSDNDNDENTPTEIEIFPGPSLLSPADNSSTSITPYLNWSIVSGANEYALIVATTGGAPVVSENTGATSNYTVPSGVLNANTEYIWQTGVELTSGEICYSEQWNFTTQCADNFEPNDDYNSPNTTAFTPFSSSSNQNINAYITSTTDKDYYQTFSKTYQVHTPSKLPISRQTIPLSYFYE